MKISLSIVLQLALVPQCMATDPTPSALLRNVINAIGGAEALNEIKGLSLQSSLFRSRSLTQSYVLEDPDKLVATTANQTISWDLSSNSSIRQRIDRSLIYDNYWRYAHRSLRLISTLVVQTGSNGSACFNKGADIGDHDPSVPYGYADAFLTDYLIHSAEQSALLYILKLFSADVSKLIFSNTKYEVASTSFPTLTHPQLNFQLLINNGTYLPYAIRSVESHKIYATSSNDIVFSYYQPVKFGSRTIQHPRRIQTIYNDRATIEDIVVSNVTINPDFTSDYFRAVPPPQIPASLAPKAYIPQAPRTNAEYPRSEVHEFYDVGLWFGPFTENNNISTLHLAPVFPGGSVPQVQNVFIGSVSEPGYVQGLLEFEDGYVITDAPPHRGTIIVEWLAKNRPGKKITHVVPSHHHRDHSGGVGELVAAGAKLVVPEVARDYYTKVNGGRIEIITYTADKPWIKRDKNIQFMSFWQGGDASHAVDWVYSVAGPVCGPRYNKSEVAIFEADVINPTSGLLPSWDTAEASPVFSDMVHRGIPIEAQLIGAHGATGRGLGTQDSLRNLTAIGGFPYPNVISEKRVWC